MLDRAPNIGLAHLNAALALWRFVDQSAGLIFCYKIGDPIADTILTALRAAGPEGKTRTELWQMLSHATPSRRIDQALQKLVNLGAIESRQIATKGRSAYGTEQQPSYSLTHGSRNARSLAASFPNRLNYGPAR